MRLTVQRDGVWRWPSSPRIKWSGTLSLSIGISSAMAGRRLPSPPGAAEHLQHENRPDGLSAIACKAIVAAATPAAG